MDMNHQHTIISAFGMANPPTTTEDIDTWLNDIVTEIDMKVLMGPYAIRCETQGNVGVTGVVVIETSHISCHCWDSIPQPFLKADVYSCKDYDVQVVLRMFERFQPTRLDYLVVDRNDNMVVTEEGSIDFL